jgi:hypothetical protein
MGAYCYSTSPKAVKSVTVKDAEGNERQVEVQVYKYAFKPHRRIFDAELNERAYKRYVDPAVRAFGKAGTEPLPYGTLGQPEVGMHVFKTGGAVSVIDEDDHKIVGTIVPQRPWLKGTSGTLLSEEACTCKHHTDLIGHGKHCPQFNSEEQI